MHTISPAASFSKQHSKPYREVTWYVQLSDLFIQNNRPWIMATKTFISESISDSALVEAGIALTWPGIGSTEAVHPTPQNNKRDEHAQASQRLPLNEALWYMQPNDVLQVSDTAAFMRVASKKFLNKVDGATTVEVIFEEILPLTPPPAK